jgi:hypothetical protein
MVKSVSKIKSKFKRLKSDQEVRNSTKIFIFEVFEKLLNFLQGRNSANQGFCKNLDLKVTTHLILC